MSEIDYDKLTPGIRDTVRWLNANGFITTDSGDGVMNIEAGMEGAMQEPNVTIMTTPSKLVEDAKRLKKLLDARGIHVEPLSMDPKPSIQATFDPSDETAVILLLGVDDKLFHSTHN